MNIDEKAATAKRLLDDEGLRAAIAEIRDTATAVFLDTASTPEGREQAHQDVRAIEAIRNRLTLWTDAKKIADKKKGQHREQHD
jgi:hypothetical protein